MVITALLVKFTFKNQNINASNEIKHLNRIQKYAVRQNSLELAQNKQNLMDSKSNLPFKIKSETQICLLCSYFLYIRF